VQYIERTRRYYEAQGFERAYEWAHFEDVPFTRLSKPLSKSTLALVTTAALYDRRHTDLREVASAPAATPPERLFANDLAWQKDATHMEDLGSYFPLRLLDERVEAGALGAVARRFHCAPTEYSHRRTLELDGPEVLSRIREDRADLALLVPL
jgi:hypothetical protein